MDQNEKLAMFVVTHVSKKVFAHSTMPLKDNFAMYVDIFYVCM